MKTIEKRAMTLLEIMIVIFIIGIIGSVIGFNMKGSLEEGKAFKSREGARQIYEVLTLEFAKGNLSLDEIDADHLYSILRESSMVRNAAELVRDGWGHDYLVSYNHNTNEFVVRSLNYEKYAQKKDLPLPLFMGGADEEANFHSS